MALCRPVKTKTDFVRRYAAGEFGNASPTWQNAKEFEASDYDGLCHIRNRVAGGATWYNLKPDLVPKMWRGIEVDGLYQVSQLYISAMAPTEKTLIQGEVMRTHLGLEMFYSFVKKPMRDALKEGGVTARGVSVIVLLKHFMNTASYEWLNVLLDRYPDHVVEFSVYDCEWGTVSGYNTVFWEVRLY